MVPGMALAGLLAVSIAFTPSLVAAQSPGRPGIYVVYDSSNSMWGALADGSRKEETARRALADFVAGDFPGHDLALRVYGHRRAGDCADTELLIPFDAPATVVSRLRALMPAIRPKGRTPITLSLIEALADFGERAGEIILISDGIETCGADPCALVRAWAERNVRIRVHVVGLGLNEKERAAMQCIAEAASTPYRDARSAAELGASLAAIRAEAARPAPSPAPPPTAPPVAAAPIGQPAPQPPPIGDEFRLHGRDATGGALPVEGTLTRDGADPIEVASERRHVVAPGTYRLSAGVRTANGSIYRPAMRNQIVAPGRTEATVLVERPPSVRVLFRDRGRMVEPTGSITVTAFRNGRESFRFRWIDEVFLDEGAYEFHARPNAESALRRTETFAAGDRKQIVFDIVHDVQVTVRMTAAGSGLWFRENYELWQSGQRRYTIHVANGARVLPGTYELRLVNPLVSHTVPDVVIGERDSQHFDVAVPVGHVTIRYQKADGTPDRDDRAFVGRGPDGSGIFRRSGEKVPLAPGTYNVTGWGQKGTYDPVVIEIAAGEERDVVLRAR